MKEIETRNEEDEDEDRERRKQICYWRRKNRSKIEKSEKKDNVRQKMINLHLLKRLVIVSLFLFPLLLTFVIKIENEIQLHYTITH